MVMHSLQHALRLAREAAGLSREEMAVMLDVDVERVNQAEEGTQSPDGGLVSHWAAVLGRTVRELVVNPEASTPLRAVLRSAVDTARDRGQLMASGEEANRFWYALGRSAVIVRYAAILSEQRAAWAQRLLADRICEEAEALRGDDHRNVDEAWAEGERLARAARAVFVDTGVLEDAPGISSLTGLYEALGLSVIPAPEESLPATIGAVLVVDGEGAGVLLDAGGGNIPRLRWSLAHELCHLIVDRDALGAGGERPRLLLASARTREGLQHGRTRLRQPLPAMDEQRFEHMEKRANAFAAYFLAPREQVYRVTGVRPEGGMTPARKQQVLSVSTIHAVADTFGISDSSALHHVPNCYFPYIAKSDREHAACQPGAVRGTRQRWPGEVSADGFPPGWFVEMVIRAVREGRLDLGSGYELLEDQPTHTLGSSVGVPDGPGPLRDPVFDAECRVRKLLVERGVSTVDMRFTDHEHGDSGTVSFVVEFTDPTDGARIEHVSVTRDGLWGRLALGVFELVQ